MICRFICFIAFLILLPFSTLATPKKIIIYFLSPMKTSYLPHFETIKMSTLLANNDEKFMDQCQPMGEGCFHPQLGFVNQKPSVINSPTLLSETEKKLEVKTFNSLETNMINCDKDYYFDLYCGKTLSQDTWNGNLEIWFDISSSLKEVDFSVEKEHCHRRSFYEKIKKSCGRSLRAALYNTNIKELGDHSGICANYGTNDEKRLVEWIKASEAKKLIIITDIDELSRSFRDFLDKEAASFVGDDVKAYTVKNLVDDAGEILKTCQQ